MLYNILFRVISVNNKTWKYIDFEEVFQSFQNSDFWTLKWSAMELWNLFVRERIKEVKKQIVISSQLKTILKILLNVRCW